MKLDRAEWTGTGAALLFHVALIGAMSMSLASVNSTPESPAMEVEFIEDVGLTAAAPQSVAVPTPASQAPEAGEAEPTEPARAVASAIARQAQRCADREPFLGEGADQVQINLKLYLTR